MKNLVILEGLEYITICRGKNERHIEIPDDKIYSHEQKRQYVRNLFGDEVADQLLGVTYDIIKFRREEWAGTKAVITDKDFFDVEEDIAKKNMHKITTDDLQEAKDRADIIIRGINFAIKGKADLVKPRVILRGSNKTVKSEKPAKERKTAPKPLMADGPIMTLKDICDSLGTDPSKARRILRKHESEIKVTGKWEWNTEEHMNIIEKVKGLLQ